VLLVPTLPHKTISYLLWAGRSVRLHCLTRLLALQIVEDYQSAPAACCWLARAKDFG